MEASVRYIPTDRHPRLGAVGNKPACCFRGTKKAHCVINDELNVHVVTLPLDIFDKSPPVPGHWGQGEYPPTKFRDFVLKKLTKPVTVSAMRLLDSIGDAKPFDPDEVPTEPESAPPSGPSGPRAPSGSTIVAAIAAELKIASSKIRKFLRSVGLHAPYEDEKVIREKMARFGKEPKKPKAGKETKPAATQEVQNGATGQGRPDPAPKKRPIEKTSKKAAKSKKK